MGDGGRGRGGRRRQISGSGRRSGVRTAAIFAWRLGGIRVAAGAGAFMFAIFDDGGRRTGAATKDALIGEGVEFEAAAAAAVVSIASEGRASEQVGGGARTGEEDGASRRGANGGGVSKR